MATILIVDDSHLAAKQIATYLRSQNHTIIDIAYDGEEGVELFKKHRPDLVTLDITMPNLDGRECLCKILDMDHNAKTLIVSAIAEESVLEDCITLGAKGYVEKPLKFREEDFCIFFSHAVNAALQ